MDRIRVAALQYYIRPVRTFEEFADQVAGLVDTAAGYGVDLLVFPEYFTCQLLTLGNVKRPIRAQIRDLAAQVPRFVELMEGHARRSGIHVVAGTIPASDASGDAIYNQSFVFAPNGNHAYQRKLHMTRFETEEWNVVAGSRLRVFETALGRIAIAVCYDVEFPEIARAAAREDVHLLVVPSCTDDRQGFFRVRYCAHARTIENQIYVVHSPTVGSLPNVPAVALNYGQAAILTPSDFAFSRDGILAEGIPNQESMVIGDLNMRTIVDARQSGTVLPLRDSVRTADVLAQLETVKL